MALALPQNNNFVWTPQATIQLIRERRTFHDQFERVPNNRHVNIWTIIANRVHAATNFVANPQDFPIRSPNNFDRCCFIEMSDQFWLRTGDYLFQICASI